MLPIRKVLASQISEGAPTSLFFRLHRNSASRKASGSRFEEKCQGMYSGNESLVLSKVEKRCLRKRFKKGPINFAFPGGTVIAKFCTNEQRKWEKEKNSVTTHRRGWTRSKVVCVHQRDRDFQGGRETTFMFLRFSLQHWDIALFSTADELILGIFEQSWTWAKGVMKTGAPLVSKLAHGSGISSIGSALSV